MASSRQFVDYLLDQLASLGEVTARPMMGEYVIYCDGKLFGSVCDNKLFIKPTEAGRGYIGDVIEAPPYPGAKNNFLIEERIDDREWLCGLVSVTLEELPKPKPKKPKKTSSKKSTKKRAAKKKVAKKKPARAKVAKKSTDLRKRSGRR
ncbi:MAG: TfoX/Sxy family protein [Planctomycetota bacterium]